MGEGWEKAGRERGGEEIGHGSVSRARYQAGYVSIVSSPVLIQAVDVERDRDETRTLAPIH